MTSGKTEDMTKLEELSLPLERDLFLRGLIRELAGTLQDVVGVREASGYISVVGPVSASRSTMTTRLLWRLIG